MTENKHFTLKGLVEGVPNIADKGEIIEQEDAVRLLNEQNERIKELEKEKQILKNKAKILFNHYLKRYDTAIFNNARHSKQFRNDFWIVKEVLYVLDLYQ